MHPSLEHYERMELSTMKTSLGSKDWAVETRTWSVVLENLAVGILLARTSIERCIKTILLIYRRIVANDLALIPMLARDRDLTNI